jgi:hypothetical protein
VLALTVLGYFLISFVFWSLMPSREPWRLQLLIDIGFSLAWFAVLLRTVGKPERFLQTATAFFGYELLLAPAWIIGITLLQGLKPEDAMYVPLVLIVVGLAIWFIRAASYILKAALELPIIVCVLLTILQTFTATLLVRALAPSPEVVTTTS